MHLPCDAAPLLEHADVGQAVRGPGRMHGPGHQGRHGVQLPRGDEGSAGQPQTDGTDLSSFEPKRHAGHNRSGVAGTALHAGGRVITRDVQAAVGTGGQQPRQKRQRRLTADAARGDDIEGPRILSLQRQDGELGTGDRARLIQQDRPQHRRVSQQRPADADEARGYVHKCRRNGALMLRAEQNIDHGMARQLRGGQIVRREPRPVRRAVDIQDTQRSAAG